MDFFFLVLTTLTFFLRPDEVFPELQGLQVYYGVIVCTLLLSSPRIIQILTSRISHRPVLAFVLTILLAIPVSHIVNGSFWMVLDETIMFAKVAAYFVAILAIIHNKWRWQAFAITILCGGAMLSSFAVVDFFEIYDFPFIEKLVQQDSVLGETVTSFRLRACGVFNDPNDLAMLTVVCICLCGGVFRTTDSLFKKATVLLLCSFFFWILILTKSRGGLLGLLGAVTAYSLCTIGFKRSLPIVIIAVLGMIALGGRQGDIGSAVSSGTGHSRTELWFGTIQCFKTSPLIGIGSNTLADEIGQVTHNSFLHIVGELGLVGGFAFVGCFVAEMIGLWTIARRDKSTHSDPSFQLWAAPLLAMLSGAAACQYSISRSYVIPTYLFLGLAGTYLRLNHDLHGIPEPKLEKKLIFPIAGTLVGLLVSISLIIRFT